MSINQAQNKKYNLYEFHADILPVTHRQIIKNKFRFTLSPIVLFFYGKCMTYQGRMNNATPLKFDRFYCWILMYFFYNPHVSVSNDYSISQVQSVHPQLPQNVMIMNKLKSYKYNDENWVSQVALHNQVAFSFVPFPLTLYLTSQKVWLLNLIAICKNTL